MSKDNGTKPKKARSQFVSRSEVAAVLGVPIEHVRKEHVLAALRFTLVFDEIVGELFTEEWFAKYAEAGESRLTHIPLHGLTTGSIWSDCMLIETGDDNEPSPEGMMFVQGFATAFSALIRWHSQRMIP